jgi:hypothetical protein
MDFSDPKTAYIAYIAANLVGLFYLYAAIRLPRVCRLLFFILFGWASWINYTTSHQHPGVYLMYAQKALSVYADFINGWFKQHITVFVSTIAIVQGLIAIAMLLKGIWVKLACIGVIVFLFGIAPLGLYAAFPFSLIVSGAAYFIYKNNHKAYIWTPLKSKPK